MPGNGKVLLDFKIDLLKAALGKKATLLDAEQEDLLPTVELLYHISLREDLHKKQIFRTIICGAQADQTQNAITLSPPNDRTEYFGRWF